jgi:hypothetical protein
MSSCKSSVFLILPRWDDNQALLLFRVLNNADHAIGLLIQFAHLVSDFHGTKSYEEIEEKLKKLKNISELAPKMMAALKEYKVCRPDNFLLVESYKRNTQVQHLAKVMLQNIRQHVTRHLLRDTGRCVPSNTPL